MNQDRRVAFHLPSLGPTATAIWRYYSIVQKEIHFLVRYIWQHPQIVTSALKSKMFNKQTVFALFGLFDEYCMFVSCELAFILVFFFCILYKNRISRLSILLKRLIVHTIIKLLLNKVSQRQFSFFLCLIKLHVCI